MALRLVEAIIPEQYTNDMQTILSQQNVFDYWLTCGCEDNAIFKIILPVEDTEALLNAMERRYGHLKGFRMILLPLEASIPSPKQLEQKEEENNREGQQGKNKKPPLRVSRQELYNEIYYGANLNGVFMTMVFLSSVVAAIGLIRNNTAVVIGAMVIAPLLGPNVALALAATLGDSDLGRKAIKTTLGGVSLSFIISIVLGFFIPFDPNSYELVSRTAVSLADIILALASGVAGAMAFTSAMSSALIGVMVAVALVPPLVASGLLLGGGHFPLAADAFLLLVINTICLNIAGIATFLVQGIRPFHWWEAKKAKKMTIRAMALWIILLLLLLAIVLMQPPRIGPTVVP